MFINHGKPVYPLRVELDLYLKFRSKCQRQGKTMGEVLNDAIERYVNDRVMILAGEDFIKLETE